MESVRSFAETALLNKVARMCKQIGYGSISQDSCNTLVDIYRNVIYHLGRRCKEAANNNNRIEPTIDDLQRAFELVGIPFSELDANEEIKLEVEKPPAHPNKLRRDILLDGKEDNSFNGDTQREASPIQDTPCIKDIYADICKNFQDNPVTADKRIRLGGPVIVMSDTKLRINAPLPPELKKSKKSKSEDKAPKKEEIVETKPPPKSPERVVVVEEPKPSTPIVPASVTVESPVPSTSVSAPARIKKLKKPKKIKKVQEEKPPSPPPAPVVVEKVKKSKKTKKIKDKPKSPARPQPVIIEKVKKIKKSKKIVEEPPSPPSPIPPIPEPPIAVAVSTATIAAVGSAEAAVPVNQEDLCPICRLPDDGSVMIQCDEASCARWFHSQCVNLEYLPKEDETWFCKDCVAASNQDELCPICRLPDDGTIMIQCDETSCARWFHGQCVNLSFPPKEDENWFCNDCNTKRTGSRSKAN